MHADRLANFIVERDNVRRLKECGVAKPWTNDLILRSYRFCNVCREDDTETKWIAQNWRNPNVDEPHLWFAMMVARLFNWHDTLQDIGFPIPFDARYLKRMRAKLINRIANGQKVWTGAYMVSTNGQPVMYKHDYVIEKVLKPAWRWRDSIWPQEGDTLQSFFERLMTLEGMGSFMAGQVIADLKYAEGTPLYHAADWDTWATPGPGSKRGLNRVYDRPVRAPWRKDEFLPTLQELRKALLVELAARGFKRTMHAQDVQNCLCEFDKYERVRLEEGRPRSRYNGAGEV